jgi:hypothetical protein
MLRDRRDDGLCRRRGARQGGRHVEGEHRVVVWVGQERPQRAGVAVGAGIADDVDRVAPRPGRRQGSVELRERRLRQAGERAAEIDEPVDGEHADAAAVGDDGQALAGEGLLAAECLGSGEQFVEIEHAQQARASEGCILDRVGSGEGAGMRRCGARSALMAARFDDDNRLDAGGGTRRRHEFPGPSDRLDIEQDGAGHPVGGGIIETIGKIHIGLVAERDDGRQADAAAHGPLDETGGDRARL